ncbi:helix-turn-helix domain-containing protein [Halovulum sp. GXIMD14794]
MGSEDLDTELRGFDAYEVRLGDHLRGERATLGKSLLDVQRELRIRASYIAAIENCDMAVFPNPGFVAGYVRSYARYLKLNPDEVFARFCHESGFDGVNAALQNRKSDTAGKIVSSGPVKVASDDPLMRSLRVPASDLQPGMLERMSVSAIGSVLVLAMLVGGVAYGGYRVLQNIQRVTIVPVDQRPDTLSDLTGLSAPSVGTETAALDGTAADERTDDIELARLYQPRELEVPVVESRDGPIVDINPAQSGYFMTASAEQPIEAETPAPEDVLNAVMAIDPDEPLVREPASAPMVHVVAQQPAWVRIYLGDGTVLFEKILETGETYTLPTDIDQAPLLRAGNAGSVYIALNETSYGPMGKGASVIKNVSLLPDDVREAWPEVADPPEIVSATVSALNLPPAAQ